MPNTIPTPRPVEIAIIGGGIIGLVLAVGLLQRGIRVKIYEQARSLKEIGAGMAFTANAIRCMGLIDPAIVKALREVATPNGDWLQWVDGYNQHFEDPRQEKLLYKLYTGYRGFEGCHRALFLDALAKNIPEGVLEFSKRLDTLIEEEQGERVKLTFVDGTVATADAVIGCDGIKSRVRQILLGEGNPASHPHYSHNSAYRGLIPMNRAIGVLGDYKARNQHMHIGPKAHIIHYPVAGQTLINFAAFVSDPQEWPTSESLVAPGTRQEVQEVFKSWGPTVRDLTGLLPDELDKWAIFDTFDHPAPYYNKGLVCVAGDAAHASAPHHGAGAVMGIEDALCICTLFEKATKAIDEGNASKAKALSLAFETYNSVRKERSQWLVASSRKICHVYEWQDPDCSDDADKCFKEIEWRSHKIWNFDIEGMLQEAIEGYDKKINETAVL